MALGFNGTDYLHAASAVVTGAPTTIVGWAKPRVVHSGYIAALGNGSDTSRQGLFLRFDGTLGAIHRGSSVDANIYSSVSYTAGNWVHGAAVFDSLTSRSIFVNGANKQTSSAVLGSISLTETHLGSRPPGTFAFDGELAEVAIWSAALSDGEIASLASGFSPLTLTHRLGSLELYQDLIRGTNRPGTGPSLSTTGALTPQRHPRMLYPGGQQSGYRSVVPPLYGRVAQLEGVTLGAVASDTYLSGAPIGQTYPAVEVND